MGLFDFVGGIGSSLFGSSDDKKAEEAAAEAKKAQEAADAEAMRIAIENRDKAFGESLEQVVQKLALPIEELKITYSEALTTVEGRVPTNEVREKVILAVGNVDVVTQLDDKLEVTNPEPEAVFYVVKKGDSLSKIAKEFYGDYKRYPEIFEANKPMLTDPDLIYPGQTLRIPGAEKVA